MPLSIRISAANRSRAILSAFITLFSVCPSSVCSSSGTVHPVLSRQWGEVGTPRSPGGGGGGSWNNMRRTCCEEPGGDGIVILVIKDRVASMAGVRTGCGKLLESLWRKAAPSLFYPFSGDLIIFSNSQDGILYPLFPHLLLPSSCLCSFPFTSLCHFLLKCIWNSELTKTSWPVAGLKCKCLALYSCKFVKSFHNNYCLTPHPQDVNGYGNRHLLTLSLLYFIQIIPISPLTFCSGLLQAVVLRWGTP